MSTHPFTMLSHTESSEQSELAYKLVSKETVRNIISEATSLEDFKDHFRTIIQQVANKANRKSAEYAKKNLLKN